MYILVFLVGRMPRLVLVPLEGMGCGTSRDKWDKPGQVGQVGTSWTSRDKLDKSGQVGQVWDKVHKFPTGLQVWIGW